MLLRLLRKLSKRRKVHRLRRIMRGYRYIKQSKSHGSIRALRGSLTNTPLWSLNRHVSPLIYGAGLSQAELVTRQYLLTRVGGIPFNLSLLYSFGTGKRPLIHPIPKVWQDLLIKDGIPVARIRCSIVFSGYITALWAYGVFIGIKTILAGLRTILQRTSRKRKRYAYFCSLTAANLPQTGMGGQSHDIVSWYSQWEDKAASLDALCHSVANVPPTTAGCMPVVSIENATPELSSVSDVTRYTGWWLKAVFRSALDAVMGRWWHAMLLGQGSLAKKVRLSEPQALAKDYLFHNSGHIYRPLWTYEAEVKGSRVILYFYSTSEQFKSPQGYVPDSYEWGAMNWLMYLVWNDYQKNALLRGLTHKANIEMVGMLWFQDNAEEVPAVSEKSLAVFDVEPHRSSSHFGFTTMAELYWNKNVEIKFLTDIHSALKQCGGTMLHKRKRDIGKRARKAYLKHLRKLSIGGSMVSVNPGVAPSRLIEKCAAVISMPFTSTALIGAELGKPSVYYDPLSILQKDDRAAHGVELLLGQDELCDWVQKIFTHDELALKALPEKTSRDSINKA